MKVTLEQCKTPTCRGCGRRMGFEHYQGCTIARIDARRGETGTGSIA